LGNGFTSPNKPQKQAVSEYKYRMDTYVGHLGCMWQCWHNPFRTRVLKNGTCIEVRYASVRNELLKTGGSLIKRKIFPEITTVKAEALFDYLVFLVIFTYDLGKLQQKWQEVMRGWQEIAHTSFQGKNPRSHLLAHTDYNPDDPQQKVALKNYEKQHKRPNHAVESAFLARYILTHFNHFRESKLQNPHSERLQGIVLTFQAFYQERDREIPAQVQPSELANDFTFPRVIKVGYNNLSFLCWATISTPNENKFLALSTLLFSQEDGITLLGRKVGE
jgi:hypothetical protein